MTIAPDMTSEASLNPTSVRVETTPGNHGDYIHQPRESTKYAKRDVTQYLSREAITRQMYINSVHEPLLNELQKMYRVTCRLETVGNPVPSPKIKHDKDNSNMSLISPRIGVSLGASKNQRKLKVYEHVPLENGASATRLNTPAKVFPPYKWNHSDSPPGSSHDARDNLYILSGVPFKTAEDVDFLDKLQRVVSSEDSEGGPNVETSVMPRDPNRVKFPKIDRKSDFNMNNLNVKLKVNNSCKSTPEFFGKVHIQRLRSKRLKKLCERQPAPDIEVIKINSFQTKNDNDVEVGLENVCKVKQEISIDSCGQCRKVDRVGRSQNKETGRYRPLSRLLPTDVTTRELQTRVRMGVGKH